MQWFGKATPITRFLGQVDQDDPTNLPVGLAAICRNTDFTRDSGGVTCAPTRAGNNRVMQGTDPKASITGLFGFRFSPALPTQSFFQMPIVFDSNGHLQYESPVGSGRLINIPAGAAFTPPANTHMIGAQAANKLWAAYSDLILPKSGCVCVDPNLVRQGLPNAVNPFGMKPVGWNWQPNTDVLAGEVATPSAPRTGNGHTYQAQNSGTTGNVQPVWPLNEGGTVVDNPGASQVVWKERTMVLANRLPAPAAPAIALAGGGAFGAGLDVYVIITLNNNQGETLPSLTAVVTTVAGASSVAVTIPALAALAGWIQGLTGAYVPFEASVYVKSVATGSLKPAISTFQKFGGFAALGSVVSVTGAGGGAAPPTVTTARVTPGQLPTPDVQPIVARSPGAGAFAAGRDVYVLKTFTNALGETRGGPANVIVNTTANDAVQVTLAVPEDELGGALYAIQQIGIYEADVPTGTPAPPSSQFQLVGYYAVGATPVITTTAAGPNPPTTNTTGPGGQIVANTATGGANGTQGFRYGACLFMNQNETTSGFTLASVVSCIIDQDGWEIGAFNIPTGPANIVARLVAFSVADSSQSGPFNWIGLINLLVPVQNVVYPTVTNINQVGQSATAILDNVTTQATFNFTDIYLANSNNVDDRMRIIQPPKACRIDYLKSIDRVALSGAEGYYGGGLISLGASDYESFYGDTSPLPFPVDGNRCWGFTDAYKSVIFALREDGGYTVDANTGDPASWNVQRRWSDVGPCGFRAWDAIGKYIFFVNEYGAWMYDQSDPDLMSKEVPEEWATVNWAAGQGIVVTADEDTHTVRIQVPTGQSVTNNKEFCLSYLEGWQDPIHFSTYSGKEVSMDAARRWTFNDVAANVCVRIKRTLPPGPAFIQGPDWTTLPNSSYSRTQLLYGSAGGDGYVNARTPGIYSDNGAGIDWVYETMSSGMMQALCKAEGFNLNCSGNGLIHASFMPSRSREDDAEGNFNELKAADFALVPGQSVGITRRVETRVSEFWRMRFTNGKQPDAWCSLKSLYVYMIPFTVGRGSQDKGQ